MIDNIIYSYKDFTLFMKKTTPKIKKSIEQIIQFDSKYFKIDNDLLKYDLSLLTNNSVIKKLFIILRNREDEFKDEYKVYIDPYKINGFEIKTIYLYNFDTNLSIELKDLILIDNSFCIIAETKEYWQLKSENRNITSYFLYDCKHNESKIKQTRDLINNLKKENFRQHNSSKIFEPLSESADLNYKIALENCSGGVMSNGDCKWYHSVWQYLRIINKVSSPEWHSAFYEKCFDKLFKEKDSYRVLISGTADYSLLAYVYNSCKHLNKNIEIFVLDTCKTPLKICKWYAKKQKFAINILHKSIFELPKLCTKFDLICSDAFLTRFSKIEAERVVAIWYHCLNKNGMIVTTVRIRDNETILEDDSSAKKEYIYDCIERFKKWKGYFNISSKQFESMVEEYVNHMTSNNLGNKIAIANIFQKQGFDLEIENTTDTPGELSETKYYEICCRKREVNNEIL